jgi:hypothetical protein
MADREQIERVRQAIMRLRELLTLMRGTLENSERAYDKLFADMPPDVIRQMEGLREKERQWKLAEQLIADLDPLERAVSQTRFDMRELYRAFGELSDITNDIVASMQSSDSDSDSDFDGDSDSDSDGEPNT